MWLYGSLLVCIYTFITFVMLSRACRPKMSVKACSIGPIGLVIVVAVRGGRLYFSKRF